MERTKIDEPIRYKKIGRGSFHFNGKIIKPNQVFLARPSQISKSFKDLIIPLDSVPQASSSPEPQVIPHAVVPEYKVEPRGKSLYLFDVLMKIGAEEDGTPKYKVLNEKGLKREVADEFVRDLLR